MTNFQSSEVYTYLSEMYRYLKGDLNEFHKICTEAEKRDQTFEAGITSSNARNMDAEPTSPPTSSITTTFQTTKAPEVSDTYYQLASQNRDEAFRLTIPISLSLFAIIDYLGFLSGANEDPLITSKNFREFFNRSTIPVTTKESDFINNVFRQGLTHVYFPKLNLGVAYHSSNPVDKLIFKDGRGFLILNINRLEQIVISTFDKIKDDSALYPTMEAKYQTLLAQYQKKHGSTIQSYNP